MLRVLDILISIAALVLTAPLLMAAMIAVRIDSRGPAIFAQNRVGRGRRVFTCYKVRTMARDTRQGASHEVGGATITPVGRVLRRTKIDELPQLWNVIVGDMSLVGPRPCLPGMNELIEERDRRGVYRIRPGVTGLAQIAGIDMSDPPRLAEVDAAWLEQASLRAYLRLLVMTVSGRGRGDAATLRV